MRLAVLVLTLREKSDSARCDCDWQRYRGGKHESGVVSSNAVSNPKEKHSDHETNDNWKHQEFNDDWEGASGPSIRLEICR